MLATVTGEGETMPTMKDDTSELSAFTRLVDKLLSVPKSEILRREAEYRKQADLNPNRRGPKRKAKE
jgi:hypothetical protein